MPGYLYRFGEMNRLLLAPETPHAARVLFEHLFCRSLLPELSYRERVDLFLAQESNLQPVDEVLKYYGDLAAKLLHERLAETHDISVCLTRFAAHDAQLLYQCAAAWESAPPYAKSVFQRSMREAASAANQEWWSEPTLVAAWGRMLFAEGQEAWRDYEGADLLAPLLVQLPEWPPVALQITMPGYAHAHPGLRFTPPEGSERVIELQLECECDEDGAWRYRFAPVLTVDGQRRAVPLPDERDSFLNRVWIGLADEEREALENAGGGTGPRCLCKLLARTVANHVLPAGWWDKYRVRPSTLAAILSACPRGVGEQEWGAFIAKLGRIDLQDEELAELVFRHRIHQTALGRVTASMWIEAACRTAEGGTPEQRAALHRMAYMLWHVPAHDWQAYREQAIPSHSWAHLEEMWPVCSERIRAREQRGAARMEHERAAGQRLTEAQLDALQEVLAKTKSLQTRELARMKALLRETLEPARQSSEGLPEVRYLIEAVRSVMVRMEREEEGEAWEEASSSLPELQRLRRLCTALARVGDDWPEATQQSLGTLREKLERVIDRLEQWQDGGGQNALTDLEHALGLNSAPPADGVVQSRPVGALAVQALKRLCEAIELLYPGLESEWHGPRLLLVELLGERSLTEASARPSFNGEWRLPEVDTPIVRQALDIERKGDFYQEVVTGAGYRNLANSVGKLKYLALGWLAASGPFIQSASQWLRSNRPNQPVRSVRSALREIEAFERWRGIRERLDSVDNQASSRQLKRQLKVEALEQEVEFHRLRSEYDSRLQWQWAEAKERLVELQMRQAVVGDTKADPGAANRVLREAALKQNYNRRPPR